MRPKTKTKKTNVKSWALAGGAVIALSAAAIGLSYVGTSASDDVREQQVTRDLNLKQLADVREANEVSHVGYAETSASTESQERQETRDLNLQQLREVRHASRSI